MNIKNFDSQQVQTFKIFLPMCQLQQQRQSTHNYINEKSKDSMTLSIYKTAKISDLIGLICCKYVMEKKKPFLTYDNRLLFFI